MNVVAMLIVAASLVPGASSAPGAQGGRQGERPIERHVERELPAVVTRAQVFHSLGGCTVRIAKASENSKPRARLELAASGGSEAGARAFLQQVDLEVLRDGGDGVIVRSLFPPKESKPGDVSFAATLTVWLPEQASLELENGYGDVLVDGRGADVKVVNKFGAVEVRRVRDVTPSEKPGPRPPRVTVENQFAAIVVADVAGDVVMIKGKSTPITVERAGGHVQAHTSGGLVRIDGAGSVDVVNSLKPVDVRNVRGDATIVAPHCAVTAKEIGGTLSIDSKIESVTVEGVSGGLSIQLKNGKLDARRIGGDARIEAHLSEIVLVDVLGAVDVRAPFSPVRVAGVRGKLHAENSTRTLEIDDARGDVEAIARGGMLKARWTRLPADAAAPPPLVSLESEAGGIEIELPAAASATLEVTSTSGQLDCDVEGMTFAQSGSARTGTAKLGDGKVRLHATCVGGAIRVRRAP